MAAKEIDLYSDDCCNKCGLAMGVHNGTKCPKPTKIRVGGRSFSLAQIDEALAGDQRNARATGSKAKKAKPAIATKPEAYGWDKSDHNKPAASECAECYAPIPPTKKRIASGRKRQAFGGQGRPKQFCSAKCRQRSSRRRRAGEIALARAALVPWRPTRRRAK